MEEAADQTVPLLERLKFISIFTSNLDEFFMVRVGSLFDLSLISPDEIDNKCNMTPGQQLERIYETIPSLVALKDQIFHTVTQQLAQMDILDLGLPSRCQKKKNLSANILKLRFCPSCRRRLSTYITPSLTWLIRGYISLHCFRTKKTGSLWA